MCGGTGVRLAGVCCGKWKRYPAEEVLSAPGSLRPAATKPCNFIGEAAQRVVCPGSDSRQTGSPSLPTEARLAQPGEPGIAGELRHLGAKTAPSLARTASALPEEKHVVVWLAASRKIHDPFQSRIINPP